MAHIQWKDRYNINYKDIDNQHKELLGILNELIDLAGGRGDAAIVAGIFQRLCDYVRRHFSMEERYMQACGYPRLVDHQHLHGTFVQKLLDLNDAYNPEDPHLLVETLEFLKHWYLDHILKTDMDYVPYLKRYKGTAPIRAILFDFGNVLCTFDNDRFVTGLAELCGQPADLLKAKVYDQSSLTRDYEAGRIGSREFLEGLSAICEQELSEAEVIRVYTEIFTPIQATFDLLRRLKPHYQLGLISNTSPWHFEHAIKAIDVFPLFDSVTLSFEVGASKPDPQLFEDALDKLGVMAEECVYIDDQRAFVQSAADHLMHALTYTTPEALLSQLRQLKVAV